MFSSLLIDHFENPRNIGALPPPAVQVAVSNPACGDELKIWVRFAKNSAVEVRYRVRGCTASIAAGSALTELLLTQPFRLISAEAVEAAVGGLPPESKHAAALCRDAVHALIRAAPTGIAG